MMGKLEQPNPDSDIGYRTDNLTRLDSVQDVRRGICIRVFRNVCPSQDRQTLSDEAYQLEIALY